jgi:ABC-type multidrug transport system ATPase subunit
MDSRYQPLFHSELKKTSSFGQDLSKALYSLKAVSVYLSGKKILDNVSCDINRGEFYFLTGPNGAGKTTFMKLLGEEIDVYQGEFGKKLNAGARELFVSKIFQDLKLLFHKTVYQNLSFAYDPSLYGSKAEFDQDLKEYTQIFGLKDCLEQQIQHISGGMQQKVAILRALLSKPDVLLADEPTSNLDKESGFKFFELLNYHCTKRKMTVVWATHDRDFIKNFHGKMIHLDKGRLIYTGNACFI